MIVHTDQRTGRLLVLGVDAPTTLMRVVGVSEHHVTVELSDKRVHAHPEIPRLDGADIPVQIVLTRENAAQLIDVLMRALTDGEVNVDALVHDLNCGCGNCPPRPAESLRTSAGPSKSPPSGPSGRAEPRSAWAR